MKRLSKILFAIYLVFLSALPSVVAVDININHTYINKTETTDLCKAVGRSYHRKGDSIRIATYNLLADGIGYYGSRDPLRAEGVCNLLCSVDADVIGLQEVSRWWFCNIKGNTPYAFIDPLRTELGGFMTGIAYNPEKLELLDYGNIPLEKGSNLKLRRIVWGLFRYRVTGAIFSVVNTHFNVMQSDISSGLVQARQLTGFVRALSENCNCPVIVTGDFNVKKRGAVSYCTSVVYDVLSLKMNDLRYSATGKDCGNGKGLFGNCIDHIFGIGEIGVSRCAILSQRELQSLSDHYLIFTDIGL